MKEQSKVQVPISRRPTMKIGFDIDGVLAKTNEEFIDFYNAKHRTAIDLNSVTSWDMYSCVKDTIKGASKQKFWGEYDNWMSNNGMSIGTYKGALDNMEKLRSDGHDVYLITARWGPNKPATKSWHAYNFRDVTDGLIFDKNKGKVCNALGIEAMFEDSPGNAVDLVQHGVIPILIDKPYNQNLKGQVRIDGVHNAYETIKTLEDELR